MIFVGSPQLGTLGSLQTLVLVLLTIAMQAVFVGIAVNNFLDPVVSGAEMGKHPTKTDPPEKNGGKLLDLSGAA